MLPHPPPRRCGGGPPGRSSGSTGYENAIIFGHAKDGNLHFVITQSFNDQAAVDQYARFIDDLVPLVVERTTVR